MGIKRCTNMAVLGANMPEYYLRIGLIMFFEEPITEEPLEKSIYLRIFIIICATLTFLLGIGPLSEYLLEIANEAAQSLL